MDEAEYLANQELLQGANRKANLHNTLAAVAAMANNPAAAAAAKMAAADQQRQYTPKQLGNMGFVLPDSGQFVGSKLYADEKKAAAEEKRAALAATLEAKAEAERIRSEDRAQQRTLMLTIAGMRGQSAREIAELKAAGKGGGSGKQLGAPTINKLSEADNLAASFADLSGGFDDKYGGGKLGIVTSTQNAIGRNFGGDYADQANWWQNYNDQKNIIRNKLFGSALTASEKKAFDEANITEGMDSKEIRRRLAQQQRAAVRARNKLIQNYGGSGYDVSAFDIMPEPEVPLPGQPAKPTAAPTQAPLTAAEQAELIKLRKQLRGDVK